MKKYFALLVLAAALLSCKDDDPAPEKIDKLRLAISTSVASYDAAAPNTWVKITAEEYKNLLTVLSGTSRYGSPEIYMNTSPVAGWSADYTIGGSENVEKIPATSYIIAWSIRTGSGPSTSLNSKLKISASQKTNYIDYASPLPSIGSIAKNTRVYFLLKTPTTPTPGTPSYTSVYNASLDFLGTSYGFDAGPEYYEAGDSAIPSKGFSSDSYSQVISTQNKQW